ncbi:peptidoglycan editing factor PgeF [Radiobacillus kanasensis]|uniref:peptidoglycan editing factor PgeF n=1 Tax=Radiobacillus kanasensis TaxID=2844358 RepID=UPI001E58F1B8|nr:peptidoglycan editing factor PgeF [Radiobacillus kanasensis]UFU00956.1 peptidoglycan editing factor PgeF [Radiobacillus kanasensis]
MKEPFQQKHPSFVALEEWQKWNEDLVVGISTREGGFSSAPFDSLNVGLHVQDDATTVVRNRHQLAENIGIPLDNWVFAEQVHTTNISVVSEEDRGKGSKSLDSAIPACDGLITKERGIVCAAFYADCVPLFFFDPETGWIGIAHAGWRGTVDGMAPKMVQTLVEQGANRESLRVAIGPSIGKANYQVDAKVIQHIPNAHHDSAVHQQSETHYLLDLQALNKELLLMEGVQETHLYTTKYCTYQDDQLFFSHRRDEGKTGRMLGFIGFK